MSVDSSETEAEFEEGLNFSEAMGFGQVHLFSYSPRSGTRAAEMSGQLDPSRMCTKEMSREEVAYMVNYLANCKFSEEWQFGKEPYSRAAPPPLVSHFLFLF